MPDVIFGRENATEDPLLYQCSIPHWQKFVKPILTGRWGTGKTAGALLKNRALSDQLARIEKKAERLWYIDENAFDKLELLRLRNDLGGDTQTLTRTLEELWVAEVVRTQALVLAKMAPYYGSPAGAHWNFVNRVSKVERLLRSIWQLLPEATTVLLGNRSRGRAIADLQQHLEALFHSTALEIVARCLEDIKGAAIQPAVGVEPIDTPASDLEEAGLAQSVVTALLNVYVAKLKPILGPRTNVLLAIPWHRFVSARVDLPQRLFEDTASIKWDKESLFPFINRRIEWEFERTRRRFTEKDKGAWYALFDAEMRNGRLSRKPRRRQAQACVRRNARGSSSWPRSSS